MKDNDTAHSSTSATPSRLPKNCKLTHREIEILQLARHGLSAKEMALQLGTSYRTVELHRANILRKLKAKNMTHALGMILTNTENLLKNH